MIKHVVDIVLAHESLVKWQFHDRTCSLMALDSSDKHKCKYKFDLWLGIIFVFMFIQLQVMVIYYSNSCLSFIGI